jgi:hypothetical protein
MKSKTLVEILKQKKWDCNKNPLDRILKKQMED